MQPALKEQHNHFSREFKGLLPTDKDAKILEIGAGYGPFLYTLRELGYTNIRGVDLSEEQVEVAKKLGLPVELKDLSESLATEKFDVILGIDILEHLSRDELSDIIPQIKQALNPGGIGLFRMPNLDSPLASVYAFADISHETFFNKSSATQLFSAAGFSHMEVYPSLIRNQLAWKEVIRRIIWWKLRIVLKVVLFATGRTWDDVVFTPNLIVRVKQ